MTYLFFLFITVFFLLVVRIVYLSNFTDLVQTANQQSTYQLELSQTQGGIYDRNFYNFVNQTTGYRAIVFPEASLEKVLELNNGLDKQELDKQKKSGKPFIVTSKVTISNDPNILVFPVKERYSVDQLAPHLVGYVDQEGQGVSGMEKAYNDLLRSHQERKIFQFTVDGVGRYVKGGESQVLVEGDDSGGVVLTLDAAIQDVVQRVGNEMVERGAIVVMDASSAEILGCASFPDFSPLYLKQSVDDIENTPMVNRALSAYSVGSTFKIATAAAALDQGISPDLTFFCSGKTTVAGRTFKCHHLAGHGNMNLQQALRDSCNPYFINLAMQTGGKRVRQTASDMGFGKAFSLAPGLSSAAGTLPSDEDFENPGETANLGFGQGKLTANPLQVSQLVYSVLNDGRSQTPKLVLGTTEDGETIQSAEPESAPTNVMTKDTAAIIKQDLVLALQEQASDQLKPSLTSAGGKSATAQTGTYDDQGVEICQAWYTGFFPAENPKYIVTVLIEGGSSGGTDAGPVFATIADWITRMNQG